TAVQCAMFMVKNVNLESQEWESKTGGHCWSPDASKPLRDSGLCRGLGPERVLGDLDQLAKRGVVLRGDVGQHLAVERDLRGLQTFHEPAVGQSGGTSGGIDADLPERAEIALLGLSIAVGVLTAMIDRIGGVTVKFRAAHPEAFGGPDHSGAALAGGGGVGDSHGSVQN